MPTNQQLISEIQQRIQILAPSYQNAARGYDLFEAYIFALMVEAAKDEGGTVVFQNTDGTTASRLKFRTSPGCIYPPRQTNSQNPPQNYTHAVITFPDKDTLEIHLGIYVTGSSGLRHEADIAVITKQEASDCRSRRVHPRFCKIKWICECKFYVSPLGLNVGRSVLGLATEFGAKSCGVTNYVTQLLNQMFQQHKKKWEDEIEPSKPTNVARAKGQFQTLWRSYKNGK